MAAIRRLEFSKLVLWSRGLCLNVILLLRTKFSVNWTINRSDVAKKRFFNVATVCHFEFAKFWYCVTWPSFWTKFESIHQISLKSYDSRLRSSDKPFSKRQPSSLLDCFWRHHIGSGFSVLCCVVLYFLYFLIYLLSSFSILAGNCVFGA